MSIRIPLADDPDEGENATVEYSFVRSPANFTIDRISGVIRATSDCHSCIKPKNYTLSVPGGVRAVNSVHEDNLENIWHILVEDYLLFKTHGCAWVQ